MTELEKLEAERDKIIMQIMAIENFNKIEYNHSDYENKHFIYKDFDDEDWFFFIKKWRGNKYHDDYTAFDIIAVDEKSIELKERYSLCISELTEITKEEFENEFNKTLKLLK